MPKKIRFTYSYLKDNKWLVLVVLLLFSSCKSTKSIAHKSRKYAKNDFNTSSVQHSAIPLNSAQKVAAIKTVGILIEESLAVHLPNITIKPEYPVAKQLVHNYLISSNKRPGGHCLAVSKSRFLKAYEQVHNHAIYMDLPKSMSTKIYSAEQVFDHLYASTSGKHRGWKSLPKKYRGRGNAGAVAAAGMGELVNTKKIWKGALRPGALMQVWRHKDDYKAVVRGISDPNRDPFGHSFIFLNYIKDENGNITGIKIADQGYQSKRTLVPRDYEIWWAANLEI